MAAMRLSAVPAEYKSSLVVLSVVFAILDFSSLRYGLPFTSEDEENWYRLAES